MECQICCEKYTSRNKKVTCIHCEYEVCESCNKKFIIASINEANCMNCKKPWNQEFLVSNFKKVFVDKEYKDHLKNCLFERELAQREESMVILSFVKKAEEAKAKIAEIKHKIRELNKQKNELDLIVMNYDISTIEDANRLIRYEARKLAKEQELKKKSEVTEDSLENAADNSEQTIQEVESESEETDELESLKKVEDDEGAKMKFYGNCPNGECKGMVSGSWICLICSQKVCRTCKEAISDDVVQGEHACDENILANLKSIGEECKRCPKCHTSIFKSGGCNQMWCTHCQVAFSWHTGEVYKDMRGYHNPHFAEFLETRQHIFTNAQMCENGQLNLPLVISNLKQSVSPLTFKTEEDITKNLPLYYVAENLRIIVELEQATENQLRTWNRSIRIRKQKNRLEFFKGNTSEKQFKTNIAKYEKEALVTNEKTQIVRAYCLTAQGIYHHYIFSKQNVNMNDYSKCYNEWVDLAMHFNNALCNVEKNYKCTMNYFKLITSNMSIRGAFVGDNRLKFTFPVKLISTYVVIDGSTISILDISENAKLPVNK